MRIRVPPNTPGESVKEAWADAHKDYVQQIASDPGHVLIYSDGSLSIERGVCRTGYGVVAYRASHEIFRKSGALGSHVEVYDAEMCGLAVAAETLYDYLLNLADAAHEIMHIHFYADNTGAIQRCFNGSIGKAQQSLHGPSLFRAFPGVS